MQVRHFAWIGMMAFLAACGGHEATQAVQNAKSGARETATRAAHGLEIGTPYDNKPDDRTTWEQQRFNQQWQQLQSFRAQEAARQAAAAAQPAQPPAGFQFVTGQKETFKNATAESINAAPVSVPIKGDVRGPSVLRAQVYLDRVHFSVGSIDGRWGRNSAITVWWYQRVHGMQPTGELDEATFRQIAGEAGYAPTVISYALTDADLKGPFVHLPDSVYDKAKLDCMCYETLKEELGEHFHVDPDFLDVLNPQLKWSDLKAGDSIVVPNVRPAMTADQPDVAKIVISIAGNSLNGFDSSGRMVFHAPTTLGAGYDPSPTETLKLIKTVPMPHFHYDPTLYHEVPDSDPDAELSPGPNSPVGVVWMALSKEHYGIHGTNEPESIGYASSHGCVRLTNWDAQELSHRVMPDVQVSFVDLQQNDVPKVARKKS